MRFAAVRVHVSMDLFDSRRTLLIEIFQETKLLICKCITTMAYFISAVVTAPFSFSLQMANHSQQQYTNISLVLLTPSECIAWLTIFSIEAVAMVTFNALEIIVYIKKRSLRQGNMYLVINQAVADVFVGGFVIIRCWFLESMCDFWAIPSSTAFFMHVITFYFFFPLASLLNLTAISLDRTDATFRPFQHRLVKKKIFGVVIVAVWITAGLFTASIVVTFFNQLSAFKEPMHMYLSYFSIFLFCLLIIHVSYSSIAVKIVCGNQPHHHGATNRDRKLTKTLFIITVASLLLTLPYVIYQIHLLVSLLAVRSISTKIWIRLALAAHFLFLQTLLSIQFFIHLECQSSKEPFLPLWAVGPRLLRFSLLTRYRIYSTQN